MSKIITSENWPFDWAEVSPWTEISKSLYEYFWDILPPLNRYGGYFQSSEPYTHEVDKNGRWRAKYMTFTQKDGRYWYLGLQFSGDCPNEPDREA